MTEKGGPTKRGEYREVKIRPLRVRYSGNGLRSVPLEETLSNIESFFLGSGMEVQFQMLRRASDRSTLAILEYLAPGGTEEDERYFGKGATEGQVLASACLEFVERQCAKLRNEDILVEATFADIGSKARDPRTFNLDPAKGYDSEKAIDWIWGHSLTRAEPVMVPANLVFCPYEADRGDKFIAWTDSNGLASGNCLEEAVLHGLLEVVERDAVVICEYNKMDLPGLSLEDADKDAGRMMGRLASSGYRCVFKDATTDIPIPVVSAFLQHVEEPGKCTVAFGCHLDPGLALMRSLTEAVQLLPPVVNHEEWIRSGSPRRFEAEPEKSVRLKDLGNLTVGDLGQAIETCVKILSADGSEVIVVDLSLPDIPFPTVRVLVTGLQPLIHNGDMRLSRRFFEVPVKLGHRSQAADPAGVEIWPIVGYR